MIETKVNLGLVDRLLSSLRRPDLRPAWKEAKQPLRRDIRDHRQKREGPSGSWAARAASTKERARYGDRPRRILGRLPTALQTIATRRSVAMKSRVAWSEVQRSGGAVGRGSRIPARDFLWASGLALDAIAQIVARHLERIWKRGG